MSSTSRRGLVAGALAAVSLSGCYVVPIGSDGMAVYPAAAVPAVVAPAPVYAAPAPAFAPSSTPIPSTMNARLYPSNDLAAQTGMLSGTVTNLMTGKGVFQLAYWDPGCEVSSVQLHPCVNLRGEGNWNEGGRLV